MTDDEILVYLFDAIKNPEAVNFAQVLNDRRVKECRVKYNNDKWNMVYETVELFAYGTWEDYVRGRQNGKYLVLDELCTMNLKVLRYILSTTKEILYFNYFLKSYDGKKAAKYRRNSIRSSIRKTRRRTRKHLGARANRHRSDPAGVDEWLR